MFSGDFLKKLLIKVEISFLLLFRISIVLFCRGKSARNFCFGLPFHLGLQLCYCGELRLGTQNKGLTRSETESALDVSGGPLQAAHMSYEVSVALA